MKRNPSVFAVFTLAALFVSGGCQTAAVPKATIADDSTAASSGASPIASPALAAPAAEPTPAASVATAVALSAKVTPPPSAKTESSVYVFGWGVLPENIGRPRGGTSHGSEVTFAPNRPLPLSEIAAATDPFARDRAAILSLAGDYKVSFHFMEALGLTTDYTPAQLYHSWATEHVRVIENTGRFISLQHTLVMFFKGEDGTVSEPMLVKHWRQDWAYEPAELHTFRGEATWARRRTTPADVAGAWSQSVFQVDDSPRYAAVGRWEHRGNLSVWNGEREWRPLPRREHSVRKDYGVMEGAHRIVLTSSGWVHEQQNWKRVAGEGAPAGEAARYVAEEWGLDRYERISGPSLVAADEYWKKTGAYWAAVRRAWTDVFAKNDRFVLQVDVDGKKLFEEHFAYAGKLEAGTPFDAADAERHARETIAHHLTPARVP